MRRELSPLRNSAQPLTEQGEVAIICREDFYLAVEAALERYFRWTSVQGLVEQEGHSIAADAWCSALVMTHDRIELRPDGWKRFERAVDIAMKTKPKPHKPKRAKKRAPRGL